MNSLLARSLDEAGIALMALEQKNTMPSYDDKELHQYLKRKYLSHPASFYTLNGHDPHVSLALDEKRETYTLYHLTFHSPVQSHHKENNSVHGRYYELKDNKNAPTVVILHGWRVRNLLFFHRAALEFLELGYNAVFFPLPYHFDRAPAGSYSGQFMVSADGVQTIESMRQAVLECKLLFNWLEKRGCESAGVFGVSLGGWISTFLCTVEPRLSFAIPVVPASDPVEMFQHSRLARLITVGLNGKIDELFEKFKSGLKVLQPARYSPVIPKEKILLVEGRYDEMVPSSIVEKLWRAWRKPPILRYSHGHLSILFLEPDFFKDIANFLEATRLNTKD